MTSPLVAIAIAVHHGPVLASAAPATFTSSVAVPTKFEPASPIADLHIERAKVLAVTGRFAEARSEYLQAAKIQRADGLLPTDALWQIAESFYAERNEVAAAITLDGLAHEAEKYGDATLAARALLEASVLYDSAGMRREAHDAAGRLERLRNSTYLPDELRATIDARLGRTWERLNRYPESVHLR